MRMLLLITFCLRSTEAYQCIKIYGWFISWSIWYSKSDDFGDYDAVRAAAGGEFGGGSPQDTGEISTRCSYWW